MSADDTSSLVPRDDDDAVSDYADLAAILTSAVPVFGGAISLVLSDWSAQRKFQRVRELLKGLAQDLQGVKARVKEEYVRSEEFADLLDHTLRRVANERHEEKRRLYRRFLLNVVLTGPAYDEQLHILRILDELQVAHIRLLGAIMRPPPKDVYSGGIGSFLGTLRERLPDFSEPLIDELMAQAQGFRIVNVSSLRTAMNSHAAQDMRNTITPFGQRFTNYILVEPGR
jgi:hypothetical protein